MKDNAVGDSRLEVLDGVVTIVGGVVHGDERGRLLGFPTANVVLSPDLAVPDGVWAGTVFVNGMQYAAAVSIGVRPTYYGESGIRLLEAHLLAFSGDLYGAIIRVRLGKMIRGQRWFGGSAELVRQVQQDVEDARRWAKRQGARPEDSATPGSEPGTSGDDPTGRRRWLRDRRVVAAARLAQAEGRLTHAVVASLAGVPVGLLEWSHPKHHDLLRLVVGEQPAP